MSLLLGLIKTPVVSNNNSNSGSSNNQSYPISFFVNQSAYSTSSGPQKTITENFQKGQTISLDFNVIANGQEKYQLGYYSNGSLRYYSCGIGSAQLIASAPSGATVVSTALNNQYAYTFTAQETGTYTFDFYISSGSLYCWSVVTITGKVSIS